MALAAGVGMPHAERSSDRFAPAPDSVPEQRVLLRVTLNGLDQGEHLFEMDKAGMSIPRETAAALHVSGPAQQPLRLQPDGPIQFHHDVSASSLELSVPATMMDLQRFAPETGSEVHLSPEIWGAYVDYDVNARHVFGRTGLGGSRPVAFGGLADLRLIGPDLVGSFGWAYDSERAAQGGLVRLDSTLTWRPASENLAVSAGDLLPPGDPMSAGRIYRFLGIQAGTEFSGTPGWSSAPVATIYGSAQAQSVLDLVLNGQRAYSASTAGGPFALTLPPGVAGSAALVVTDVTGRSVLMPVEVPRVDANLLRQGLFLWSAGLGVPRFGYATAASSYEPDIYGYANARYGLFERVTLRAHGEAGPRLGEVELGADVIASSSVALRGTLAASHSDRGVGGQGRLAISAVGPWNLMLDARLSQTVGAFDDVVSVSGRRFAQKSGFNPLLTVPSVSELATRLSWQVMPTFGLSASYQMSRFAGSGSVGIASLSANFAVAGLPMFANAFRDLGGRRSTTVMAGLSFQIGEAQGAASAGAGLGHALGQSRDSASFSVNVGQPLREQAGSVGWNAIATRDPASLFANATVEASTNYGIVGSSVQTSGSSTTTYATMRGSAGVIGWHPFVSDPVHGGIVLVDAERSGVPVELNGDSRGRTSLDGKLVLSGTVAGVPQRVSIDTMDLPIDAVPSVTDGKVVLRDGGAARLSFRVQSTGGAASFRITFRGEPPPVGTTVFSATSNAPVGKDGRAFLPSIAADEVLRVEMPDGLTCQVNTKFDGHGGVGRRLGTLACEEAAG